MLAELEAARPRPPDTGGSAAPRPAAARLDRARALSVHSKVLIFDEATSSLTDDEVEALFRVIRNLRARAVGIVFITHRLKEIYEIADIVTVLRDGVVIGTLPITEAPEATLTGMMVGRELGDYFFKREIHAGMSCSRRGDSVPAARPKA